MENIETIEEFYQRTHSWIPDNFNGKIGHFNVFKLAPFISGEGLAKPIPFKRRDYYKITLIIGNNQIRYADKIIDIKNHALLFTNPMIPYQCAQQSKNGSGYFCIFDRSFFTGFGNISQYEVFKPDGTPVIELSDEQVTYVTTLYQRMFSGIKSNYEHKYDLIRTIVFELIHYAMELKPTVNNISNNINANERIVVLFLELLERQFPIDEDHREISIRTASEFAQSLNIHVNHLNRAIKKITQKTTTQIIAERILLESKMLLKQSTLSVAEIAYALGFNEVTHFDNFFKKHTQISPKQFRNV